MKIKILSIVVVLLLLVLAGLTICSDDATRVKKIKPIVPSKIMTPEVPNEIYFCGRRIDLTRYNRHEGIDRELTSFCYLHATTMLNFKRANRFFPVIEPILKENGIPDDFKYLAVVESFLDPQVKSPAKAVGLWQFMEATGRQYGLTITSTVDERYHVEKATVAACKYLKDAYEKYGDWTIVASSYNAGMGRISGEMSKQDVDNSMDLWLVEETTRYVYRIMAMKLIFENPYKYGFVLRERDLYKPIACQKVSVSTDIPNLAAFAKQYGLTYADLKRFNPWLRDRKLVTGDRTYEILIPLQEDIYYKTPNQKVHNRSWIVE